MNLCGKLHKGLAGKAEEGQEVPQRSIQGLTVSIARDTSKKNCTWDPCHQPKVGSMPAPWSPNHQPMRAACSCWTACPGTLIVDWAELVAHQSAVTSDFPHQGSHQWPSCQGLKSVEFDWVLLCKTIMEVILMKSIWWVLLAFVLSTRKRSWIVSQLQRSKLWGCDQALYSWRALPMMTDHRSTEATIRLKLNA